jgi:hypothetical protein
MLHFYDINVSAVLIFLAACVQEERSRNKMRNILEANVCVKFEVGHNPLVLVGD